MRALAAFALTIALALASPVSRAVSIGPLEPMPIFEYHNVFLDHYFLADPWEAEKIDAGSAGPGWEATGRYFVVEPYAYVFYGKRVCRFYGSVWPGPNSHFFTVDDGECQLLKDIAAATRDGWPKWNFEGLAFPVGVPRDGGCPVFLSYPYSKPVYRLYNNGYFRGIDSNHRYVTNLADVDAMIRAGWIFEGVAFCALQHP